MEQKTIGIGLLALSLVLLSMLALIKAGLDERDAALCTAYSQLQDIQSCPAHTLKTSWWMVSAFGIGFVLAGVGGYFVYPSLPKKRPVLDHAEQKVHDLLREAGGSMYQSDLVLQTQMTKVKMTRILDKMTSKDVIDRKRRGMTNIIVLK